MATLPARLRLQALIAIVIIAGSVFVVNRLFDTGPKRPKRSHVARNGTLAQIRIISPSSYQIKVRAHGIVVPAQRVSITPQVRGLIATVHNDLIPGRTVVKGTELAAIDGADYRFAVERTRSTLAKARANLAMERGRQNVAAAEAKKLAGLIEDEDRTLILRKPQLAAAKAELFAARAEYQQAALNLKRTKLLAPFDALILDRSIALGMFASEQTPIATLVDIGQWWVRVELPVSKWKLLPKEIGQPATVWFHHGKQQVRRKGKTLQPGNSVDTRGRLATVLISIPDPLARNAKETESLILNTWVKAELVGMTIDNAVVIPPSALRANGQVWLADKNDQLEFRPIDIAYQDNSEVVVRGSLHSGERLITTPIASPVEGMQLRIAETQRNTTVKKTKKEQ